MPCIPGDDLNIMAGELSGVALMPKKPSVLMHACCGPCSTSCVERTAEDYALTLYYYNPNITDREEYYLRRDTLLHFLEAFNEEHKDIFTVGYIEGAYEPDRFIIKAAPLAEEPEGGYTFEEGLEFLKLAQEYVDIVQVRSPDGDENHPIPFELNPTPFLDIAGKIKAAGLDFVVGVSNASLIK